MIERLNMALSYCLYMLHHIINTQTWDVPNFGSGSGKSKIRLFFCMSGLAKFAAGFARFFEAHHVLAMDN